MILLVAGRSLPAAVRAALGDATVHETDADGVRAVTPPSPPEVVVLDAPSIPDVPGLVRWLRTEATWGGVVPLCLLLAEERAAPDPDGELAARRRPYDEVLHLPVTESAVRAALARARAVTGYREAIDSLYDACLARARAGGGPLEEDAEVRAARDRADRHLEALPDDPAVYAALLEEADADPETD